MFVVVLFVLAPLAAMAPVLPWGGGLLRGWAAVFLGALGVQLVVALLLRIGDGGPPGRACCPRRPAPPRRGRCWWAAAALAATVFLLWRAALGGVRVSVSSLRRARSAAVDHLPGGRPGGARRPARGGPGLPRRPAGARPGPRRRGDGGGGRGPPARPAGAAGRAAGGRVPGRAAPVRRRGRGAVPAAAVTGTAGRGAAADHRTAQGGRAMEGIITGVANGVLGLIQAVIVTVTGAMAAWGGFQWATAGGSPKRAQDGQETLVRGAIGLALALGAPAIVQTIRGWTGLRAERAAVAADDAEREAAAALVGRVPHPAARGGPPRAAPRRAGRAGLGAGVARPAGHRSACSPPGPCPRRRRRGSPAWCSPRSGLTGGWGVPAPAHALVGQLARGGRSPWPRGCGWPPGSRAG